MKIPNTAVLTFVLVVFWHSSNAADEGPVESVSIFEFASDDPKWILEDPEISHLRSSGTVAFVSADIAGLRPIGSPDAEQIMFSIVFSESGQEKFSKYLDRRSGYRLFILINEDLLYPSIRTCYGCNTLDGALPRSIFTKLSEFLSTREPLE